MTKRITTILFCFLFGTCFAQEALQSGDITISAGGGKNRFYYDKEFELVAPIELPIAVNFAFLKKFELGLEYTPILFNDRNSVNLDNSNSPVKNHVQGGMHTIGGNFNYALVNKYGMVGYFNLNGGYSILDKEHWINGKFNERHGTGFGYGAGISFRYHLGNAYDDVFPWYFDFGLTFTHYEYKIDYFRIDGVNANPLEEEWNDFGFNSLDVILRLGYRFRTRK